MSSLWSLTVYLHPSHISPLCGEPRTNVWRIKGHSLSLVNIERDAREVHCTQAAVSGAPEIQPPVIRSQTEMKNSSLINEIIDKPESKFQYPKQSPSCVKPQIPMSQIQGAPVLEPDFALYLLLYLVVLYNISKCS